MGAKDTTVKDEENPDYKKLLKEMMACNTFAGLELKFGNRQALKEDYENRKTLVPDFEAFIKLETRLLENKIAADNTGIIIIGYGYVTKGFINRNIQDDLQTIISAAVDQMSNQDRVGEVINKAKIANGLAKNPENKCNLLQLFANGASIAFHLAFLRKESNEPTSINANPQGNNRWTALTNILCLFFEKGCKDLTLTQVQSISPIGVKNTTIKNKFNEMSNNYNHSGQSKSVRTFANSYQQLLIHFKNNTAIYSQVEAKYKQLQENYSNML